MDRLNIRGPLSNHDLLKWAKLLDIPLRGVYMLDTLPKRPLSSEMGIVNLDQYVGEGTHWVAYIKNGKHVYYLDPIGDLQPPRELTRYWEKENNVEIYYNTNRLQPINSEICGHLTILFLANQL